MISTRRRFASLLVLLATIVPIAAWAATGKISGTIIDTENEPVLGAAVQIVETSQGAAADDDGFYIVQNVQPGTYTIRISAVGYSQQTITKVEVSGDKTTPLNCTLVSEAIELGGSEITEYRKPNVQLDVSTKETRFGKEDFETRAVSDLKGLLTKQPGIKIDQEGAIHVRGGREHEVLIQVDGVNYRDPLVNSSKRLLNLNALNVEEVEVLTGGDARYGNFQAALINVTTPEGSMTDYTGTFEWRTDRAFKTYSFDTDQYDYALSGPVPFVGRWLGNKKLSFFASGSSKLTNTYTPYAINRDDSDYLGMGWDLPERQNNDYSGFFKLTYQVDPKRKFNLSYTRDFGIWDVYPDGEAAIDGNYGWQYKYNVANRPYSKTTRQSVSLAWSHQVSKSTFYEIKIGNFRTETKVRPRGKDPDQFTLATDVEDINTLQQGATDSDNNGYFDGYIDANSNGQYDGAGEGYEDLNFNGQWDRGEDWVDLNGNGQYDGAEPWIDRANPNGVNNLGVWDPWDPYTDLNGNGRWDPAEPQLTEQDWNNNGQWDGERFQDANGNGMYDRGSEYSEGYDDKNRNGYIDRKDLYAMNEDDPDVPEPFQDGDMWNDTGEPFLDEPDDNGIYDGVWNPGERWWDLPSSYVSPFIPRQVFQTPTPNGQYDGPNNAFDEYEMFTFWADTAFGMDPRYPVLYTWEDVRLGIRNFGAEWINMGFAQDDDGNAYARYLQFNPNLSPVPDYAALGIQISQWRNRTLHDEALPIANFPDFTWQEGQEWFADYNNNGVEDPLTDNFLNPGWWDAQSFWQDRSAKEWSLTSDLTSQVNKYHELKSGIELRFRDLQMQSIQEADQPYNNPDVPLPEDAPFYGRGAVRDFYDHQPVEGALYFQDKMEFEGLIVRAGIRSDFIIQDDDFLQDLQTQVDKGQPGALLADRGRYVIAPRLGISHPITLKAKLYFNYGHYYQSPSFEYFYRSATANIAPNTLIGNPNLEYEKTVSYEVGVNTEFTEDWVVDVAGYYRDVYNQIGTVEQREGPITLNRYFNLGYGRARGFEFSLEKKLSNRWAIKGNYDFSYAFGKESAASEGLLQRQNNRVENRDEHPLGWDQTHKVSGYLTITAREKDRPHWFGVTWPSNWLATIEYSYASGQPYTPSSYTVGKPANLILENSARYPHQTTTDFKFDKFWQVAKSLKLTTGVEIYNVFNRRNVRTLFAETGNSHDSSHEKNIDARDDGNLGKDADHNPRNYYPPRQIILHMALNF